MCMLILMYLFRFQLQFCWLDTCMAMFSTYCPQKRQAFSSQEASVVSVALL